MNFLLQQFTFQNLATALQRSLLTNQQTLEYGPRFLTDVGR